MEAIDTVLTENRGIVCLRTMAGTLALSLGFTKNAKRVPQQRTERGSSQMPERFGESKSPWLVNSARLLVQILANEGRFYLQQAC